jgi:hypothetical protein
MEGVGRSAGAAVENEMPERCQTADAFFQRRLPNRVEDQVDTAVVREPERFVSELLARIVDDSVGAVIASGARRS